MTVVELLVSISIVGILIALLLPAVGHVRESARKVTCQNNLRQIGIGLASHESCFRHFPSNGWGWGWVGEPEWGSGKNQPGGWIYSSLPFLEMGALHDMPRGTRGAERLIRNSEMLATPIEIFVCPSRSRNTLDFTRIDVRLFNSLLPRFSFRSDYAANVGSNSVRTEIGPTSRAGFRRYQWMHPEEYSGIIFPLSEISPSDISDGMSNTYLAGEKRLWPNTWAGRPWYEGNNQFALIGDCWDLRRCTTIKPEPDGNSGSYTGFGSAHPSGWHACFADSSVRHLSFQIDPKIHLDHGSRNDRR